MAKKAKGVLACVSNSGAAGAGQCPVPCAGHRCVQFWPLWSRKALRVWIVSREGPGSWGEVGAQAQREDAEGALAWGKGGS